MILCVKNTNDEVALESEHIKVPKTQKYTIRRKGQLLIIIHLSKRILVTKTLFRNDLRKPELVTLRAVYTSPHLHLDGTSHKDFCTQQDVIFQIYLRCVSSLLLLGQNGMPFL